MRDFEGTEIKVGDTIVYAVKNSTYVSLTRGTVTSEGVLEQMYREPQPWIKVKPIRQARSFHSEREVTLTSPTCVVIK